MFVLIFSVELTGNETLAVGSGTQVGLLAVVISQANGFYEKQVVDERYRDTTIVEQMRHLLDRTMVMHFALIFGALSVFAAAAMVPGAEVAFLTVLVGLKAPYELRVATHRRASRDTLNERSNQPRAPSPSR